MIYYYLYLCYRQGFLRDLFLTYLDNINVKIFQKLSYNYIFVKIKYEVATWKVKTFFLTYWLNTMSKTHTY